MIRPTQAGDSAEQKQSWTAARKRAQGKKSSKCCLEQGCSLSSDACNIAKNRIIAYVGGRLKRMCEPGSRPEFIRVPH